MNEFKWLLFDLGGVLAEYVGASKLISWMPRFADDLELSRLWLFSPAVRAFESGGISPVLFACNVVEEFELNVSPDMFLKEFPDFVTGYYPGAEDLLVRLSARYPLAMLSNTNSLQWDKLCRVSHADQLFRRIFLSFKTGLMKPDRDAYLHVIEKLRCEPEEIVFFDDNPDNVRVALDMGIRAAQVKGFEDIRKTVLRMGLLPDAGRQAVPPRRREAP